MYASYASNRPRFRPASMGAAVAINAAVLAALFVSAPQIFMPPGEPPLTVVNIPLPKPPPREVVEPPRAERVADPQPIPLPNAPDPLVETPPTPNTIGTTTDIAPFPPPPFPSATGEGTAGGTAIEPAPLALLPATRDPRYAGDFQPDYPASERRAEREGRVTVRVRIGVDGRVTAVERIAAASDAFFDATRRQALSRWRFRPATRGEVPVESWQTLTVRFRLES